MSDYKTIEIVETPINYVVPLDNAQTVDNGVSNTKPKQGKKRILCIVFTCLACIFLGFTLYNFYGVSNYEVVPSNMPSFTDYPTVSPSFLLRGSAQPSSEFSLSHTWAEYYFIYRQHIAMNSYVGYNPNFEKKNISLSFEVYNDKPKKVYAVRSITVYKENGENTTEESSGKTSTDTSAALCQNNENCLTQYSEAHINDVPTEYLFYGVNKSAANHQIKSHYFVVDEVSMGELSPEDTYHYATTIDSFLTFDGEFCYMFVGNFFFLVYQPLGSCDKYYTNNGVYTLTSVNDVSSIVQFSYEEGIEESKFSFKMTNLYNSEIEMKIKSIVIIYSLQIEKKTY
jgi:hypothetical protein